jgi:tRNA-specific 2-thiouridylase
MKVAVLTSGGVDSSVALRLLKQQGYEVHAFYIKIWLEDELSFLGECPWDEDLQYVRNICQGLNVPLEVISMQREYWQHVIDYAIAELKRGRTPNPDIFCNQRIKFGLFYDKIDDSFHKVATGHYARVAQCGGLAQLKIAKDTWKDQTYFLAYLNQQQLQRAMFPIGDYTKTEVRELANTWQLPNSQRKDSQGLCFLGTIRFRDFVAYHLGEQTGDIIELETGHKIGEHKGFWFHTIGQRQGLRLSGGPWYVVRKDPDQNIVYISRRYDAVETIRERALLSHFNWISGDAPVAIGESFDCRVKIRHGEIYHDATVTILDYKRAELQLATPDQGLAPGQFTVFYRDDCCLGCAAIEAQQCAENPA